MPKIIFVTGIYPLFKGGAEYQMRLIADELKKDYEIIFLYLGDVPGQPIEDTYQEQVDGYKVYFVKSPSKYDFMALNYFYAQRIYSILKQEKPDFVYQRVLKFMSYYLSKYQVELNYKHLIHIADLFTLEFDEASLRGKVNFAFFKRTVSNKSQFIVQTNEQGVALNRLGVTPKLQVYNMHPTVEVNAGEIVDLKTSKGERKIVWVANIKPIKQLDIFLDLADSLADDNSLKFVIIGNIQGNNYGEDLLKRIKGGSNIVHYIDKDNDFVNEFLLNEGSLVVNTSVSEGFSNVFIQSWLRGIPVLSLNSDPDNIFRKYPSLGTCVNGKVEMLASSLYSILDEAHYKYNAIECYNISKTLFSFDNIKKIKNLL